MLPGDSVIVRKAAIEDVLKVKRTIEDLRPSLRDETIIYDLSPNHIINYIPKDYEEIYRAF